MKPDSALLVIDVQNDFCPGGALAVPEGDLVVPVINRCIDLFSRSGLPVIASRDWHPPRTSHFREFGGSWPPHCVQESAGAAFHPDLCLPVDAVIVSKGMDPSSDDYSAFRASAPHGLALARLLEELGVSRLYVAGLATDYCVRESVLDALRLGFAVTVICDGIRGVDLEQGESERAVAAMVSAGAEMISSEDLPRSKK